MKKILIGADVILDVFYDRKPFADDSAKILALCETRKIEGFVTPVTLSTVFHALKKSGQIPKVAENMSLLLTFLEIHNTDKKDFVQALNSEFTDFDCGTMNFSAENSYGISAIVTRNTKEFKNSNTNVLMPETFLQEHNFS